MIIACDAPGCVRGLVHRDGGCADPCRFCGGAGGLPLRAICKRIDEHESTVKKLLKPGRRMRPKVAARIMGKILDAIAVAS